MLNVLRRTVRVGTVTVVAMTLALSTAGAVGASSGVTPSETTVAAGSSDVGAACIWGANPPYLHDRRVYATVWSYGCPGARNFEGFLQRKRAWGWQTLSSREWRGTGGYSLNKGCRAGDTFTYRSYIVNGAGTHKYSARRRFTCR